MHAVKVPPRVFPVRQAAQGQQPVRVRIGGECVWVVSWVVNVGSVGECG
jgi:hypothetical protein